MYLQATSLPREAHQLVDPETWDTGFSEVAYGKTGEFSRQAFQEKPSNPTKGETLVTLPAPTGVQLFEAVSIGEFHAPNRHPCNADHDSQ